MKNDNCPKKTYIVSRRKDLATRVLDLTLEIKHLVEDYHLPKEVVISDFSDIIMSDLIEENYEDN